MGKHFPTVSIIIINYNGRNYLSDCLTALENLQYPKSKYEVLLVDNGSSDSSTSFVKRKFSWVKVISLSSNEGFTGGNNIGMENATGEYIVLLNNDTVVNKNWLIELVQAAQPKQVGIVSSKIFLSVPYVKVKLRSTIVQQSELDGSTNFSPRGVLLENIYVESEKHTSNTTWFSKGFNQEQVINGITLRWSTGEAEILLPLSHEKNTFTFTFHGYPVDRGIDLHLNMKLGQETLVDTVLSAHAVQNHTITIEKKKVTNHLINLVQNAGNVVLANGYSKDRGSILRLFPTHAEEFYEPDSPFYRLPTTLAAACGAAMLIKREVIDQIGTLDGHYFMYYEDIDFSLRAWKMGWDIIYAPQAKLYHVHRATSGKSETSFFINMTEKNHLFLVFSHFPFWTCARAYIAFMMRLGVSVLRQFVFRFTKWELYSLWRTRASGRIEAFLSFHRIVPHILWKRLWWSRKTKRTYAELERLLY